QTMSKMSVPRIILHIALALFGFFWMYPLLWMLFSSLKTESEFLNGGLQFFPAVPQWESFSRAWVVADFDTFFKNSVILSVSTVAIVVVVCSLMGYAIARVDFPGRKALMAVYVGTMFVPKGYTIIPVYLLIKWLGLLNTMPGVILVESAGQHV